ncbi:ABC transporter transmembrane domain-containing protein [Yinghuangia soli]|uniref:ABC transporter ATP-binding protein/permease n=1 Tax=Yinghuangia soli TaxID=2908204 RepID=A0AA41U3G5_9ACTN|nr:ABC transporter ATP-binding protein [Yinghuangia soli]MCF2529682.1 ABC transporter ATP-binding protein/permease [Yinghuangia soli]
MATDFAMPKPVHIRGTGSFLAWLIVSQKGRVLAGATLGSLWMVGLALPPYLLSRAVDEGLRPRDFGVLLGWAAGVFAAGAANAALGIARHRTMTKIRLDASIRMARAVVGQAGRLGSALPRQTTTGEVVAIGMADIQAISQSLTMTGPGVGAVVAYAVVAAVLLAISPLLAAVILLGVPLIAATVGPVLRRLQKSGTDYRAQEGALMAQLVDVAAGLRVLNGLGGKATRARRYRADSEELRAGGYRVGAASSWVGALAAGLPALFLAAVTWLAARMAAQGALTIGEMVAVYGYVAMLVVPVRFFIEMGTDYARADVAARRVTAFLRLEPELADGPGTVAGPQGSAVLYDPVSGVEVRPGLLTALAGARPADAAAVVDRLGRLVPSDATWGGVRLGEIALAEVRARILVADNEADIFAGSIRSVVAGRHDPDDASVLAAIHVAAADDIVEALPERLGAPVSARGRNLSGGQRQRLRLARAVYGAPEVLLAVEPTSAVDAHTESAMAERLRAARQGRTTVLATTSPIVLELADAVVYLTDGKAEASGTHRELLRTDAGYRDLVSRDDAEARA